MTRTQNTSAPRTVARTATRKVAAMKAQFKTCHSYSLDRGFVAEQVDPARGWLQFEAGRAKLIDNGDGTATMSFHSNLWLKYSA
jgi:hypothetical protein